MLVRVLGLSAPRVRVPIESTSWANGRASSGLPTVSRARGQVGHGHERAGVFCTELAFRNSTTSVSRSIASLSRPLSPVCDCKTTHCASEFRRCRFPGLDRRRFKGLEQFDGLGVPARFAI